MKVGEIMDSISAIITSIAERDNSSPGDYVDSEGFLVCGNCHTRKQVEVQWPGGTEPRKMPTLCECEAKKRAAEEEERKLREFQMRVSRLRRDGLTDPEYLHWTFAQDDRRRPEISDACLKYVDEWAQMRIDNVGLLFFGDVGTGKSFLACCIANALLEKCVPALVTNFPRILNKLQSSAWGEDRNGILEQLQRYELVVIDDLGVERNTSYALEQIYNIVDTRYRSGKPLIVTTNLAPAEIKTPENIGLERIYDRIMQNSIPVKVTGPSRRVRIAEEKKLKYQSLLGF